MLAKITTSFDDLNVHATSLVLFVVRDVVALARGNDVALVGEALQAQSAWVRSNANNALDSFMKFVVCDSTLAIVKKLK